MINKKSNISYYLKKIIFKKKKIKDFQKKDIFSVNEFDSMFILKLIILIESKFKIKLSDNDINFKNFNTIDKISRIIFKKLKQ